MRGTRFSGYFLSVLILNSAGFLLFAKVALAAPSHIVINEVQITGGTGHTTDDFVELFNPTNQPFDLKEYRLVKRTSTGTSDTTIKSWTTPTIIPAYGFYLWGNSGFTSIATTPDAVTSESLADNNGVALREGAADTGNIIDSVAWGTASNAFVEGSVFPQNPGANQSLERQKTNAGSRNDTNNNSADFSLQNTTTPQNTFSAVEITDNPTPTPPSGGGYSPPSPPTIQPGEVVINELVSDPSDGNEEWIELYNRTSRVIDLSGWTIEDGSKAITALSGSLGTDAASRFLTIKSPKGNLNNDGDLVVLKYGDNVIDQVAYGKWDDGNISNNAPVTGDPLSIGRLPDGTDANNDSTDFAILEPTPSATNKLANTAPNSNSTNSTCGLSFSEIYPNPPFSDEQGEFIELINTDNKSIDLKNWVLSDEISNYTFNSNDWLSTTIEPNNYLVLPRLKTKIVLENEGTEHLTLKSADGNITIKASYVGPALEGISFAKNEKGDWQWTTTPTPGTKNQINPINQPPQAAIDAPKEGLVGQLISFDSSDSVDPEGLPLEFIWTFDDGTSSNTANLSHIFTAAGKHTIKLTAKDKTGNTDTASQTITINHPTTLRVAGVTSATIILSEFMPNPIDSDSKEWVELYNPSGEVANTLEWKLIINNRVIKLPAKEILPESYLVINKSEANFTLTNSSGTITLESHIGERQPTIEYGQAAEGVSYAWGEQGWQWTTMPTPGYENTLINTDDSDNGYQPMSINELKLVETGTKVKTQGTVAVPLGIIANNILFLADSAGIQVQISGKDNLKFNLGDNLTVTGIISKSSNGTKLLIRKSDSIAVNKASEPPLPTKLQLAELNEEHEGELITTNGQITQVNQNLFTLTDGTESL